MLASHPHSRVSPALRPACNHRRRHAANIFRVAPRQLQIEQAEEKGKSLATKSVWSEIRLTITAAATPPMDSCMLQVRGAK